MNIMSEQFVRGLRLRVGFTQTISDCIEVSPSFILCDSLVLVLFFLLLLLFSSPSDVGVIRH